MRRGCVSACATQRGAAPRSAKLNLTCLLCVAQRWQQKMFEYVGGEVAHCSSHSIRASAVSWAARWGASVCSPSTLLMRALRACVCALRVCVFVHVCICSLDMHSLCAHRTRTSSGGGGGRSTVPHLGGAAPEPSLSVLLARAPCLLPTTKMVAQLLQVHEARVHAP
jgi:hypothetical protein